MIRPSTSPATTTYFILREPRPVPTFVTRKKVHRHITSFLHRESFDLFFKYLGSLGTPLYTFCRSACHLIDNNHTSPSPSPSSCLQIYLRALPRQPLDRTQAVTRGLVRDPTDVEILAEIGLDRVDPLTALSLSAGHLRHLRARRQTRCRLRPSPSSQASRILLLFQRCLSVPPILKMLRTLGDIRETRYCRSSLHPSSPALISRKSRPSFSRAGIPDMLMALRREVGGKAPIRMSLLKSRIFAGILPGLPRRSGCRRCLPRRKSCSSRM